MEDNGNKVNKINLFSDTGRLNTPSLFEFMNGNGQNTPAQNAHPFAQSTFTKQHRLNDFDSSILNNRSYLDMDDETAKLEFQITEKEKQLATLREKIKGSEQIAKVNEVLDLKIREKQITQELKELNQQYSKRSLSSKVKDTVKPHSDSFVIIDKIQKFISGKILPKVSKKFDDITKLSGSLDTLRSINQNIDELIDMKVPYGEQTQNYQKLTAYLNRANKIHSQISKSMKKIV